MFWAEANLLIKLIFISFVFFTNALHRARQIFFMTKKSFIELNNIWILVIAVLSHLYFPGGCGSFDANNFVYSLCIL